MTPQWKKRLAKEWLTLVICLVIGVLVPPLLALLVASAVGMPADVSWRDGIVEYLDLLAGLFPGSRAPLDERFFTFAIVLGPYVIYQLVRSIIWAVKALRAT